MHSRTALAVAIVCGLAAVGLVAADVAWSLEARIETETPSGWKTVAAQPNPDGVYEPRSFAECAGPELRLIVTNDKPFGDTVDVRITYFDATAKRTELIFEETWRLDRFEERSHTFTIPESAFEPANQTQEREPFFGGTNVNAQVGDLWLDACVQREATQ